MKRILIALALAFSPALALGEDAGPPPLALPAPPAPSPEAQAEQKSVQAWGRDRADCAEWSDGCVVCARDGCSTPGIACTPREIACRRK